MPSTLRFRSPYRGEKDGATVSRSPKSPRGVYTGVPTTPIDRSATKRLPLKILFGILALAALASFTLFNHRYKLIPDYPTRSSVYWKAKSTFHASTSPSGKQLFVPKAEQVQAVFADQHAFQLQGARGDGAWLKMFPKGDGRVSVTNPRRYGLPSSVAAVDGNGQAISNTEIFEVAVVKQLECMAFLRHILIDYDHETHPSAHERTHAFHCLDHVRQALLCAADTTLEPTENGGVSTNANPPQHEVSHQTVVDGERSVFESALHTCKNWTAVKGWIEENRVL